MILKQLLGNQAALAVADHDDAGAGPELVDLLHERQEVDPRFVRW
jgi:hypothetical protein